MKHPSTDKLIQHLIILYARLIELGVEWDKGRAYLADLEQVASFDPG